MHNLLFSFLDFRRLIAAYEQRPRWQQDTKEQSLGYHTCVRRNVGFVPVTCGFRACLEFEMTDDMPQKNMANMGIPSSTIPPPP